METFATILYLLPLVPLAALVAGDFRERRIGVAWLAVLAACSAANAIVHSPAGALHNLLYNFGLMAGLALALLLYFTLRMGRRTGFRTEHPEQLLKQPLREQTLIGSFKEQMGLGDPLFFLALAPMFAPRTFLPLVIACLAVSLVWWVFNRTKTVPLVGTSGSVAALYLLYGVI